MWVIVGLLAVASGIMLLVAAVVLAKKARESQRRRRTVASPYGLIEAPPNSELRYTRDVHPSVKKEVENGGKTSD